MKITKYISFITLLLCSFILLCACDLSAIVSETSSSHNTTDESLPPETTAEDSILPDTETEETATVTVVDPNAPHQDETTASETEEETENHAMDCETETEEETENHAMDCETETEASTGIPDVEFYESYRGEYNDLRIGDYRTKENGGLPAEFLYVDLGCYVYRLRVGVSFGSFHIYAISANPEFRSADFQVEVSVLEPEILEVTGVDSQKVVQGNSTLGGITVKALSPGVAHVFIKVTYIPTGGSDTIQAIVIVRDPSETAE